MKRLLVAMLVASTLITAPIVNVATVRVQAATERSASIEGKQNLIKNGDFNNGTSDWDYFTTKGGKGSMYTENGALKANIKDMGDVAYGMQMYNQSFPLYKGGKYVLKFDISSSVKRDVEAMIQLDGGDYKSYTWKKVTTTPKVQSVTIEFTMKEDTDLLPKLCFNVGKEEGYENLGEHSVTLDNVGLYLVDDSAVDYSKNQKPEAPIVLNQLGYLKDSVKQVVFRGDVNDRTFDVVNKDTGKVVYTGEISGKKYNSSARETDYYGDFSKVTTPGTYKIVTKGLGESYEFKIGDDVYEDVFKDAQRFFYYQRCGKGLSEALAGKWAHPECHQSLAKIYGTNERIDVSGGWHDAGDYGRYVVATSKSVADLILAYNANKSLFKDDVNIPESNNGTADILDELKGQFEWLFKMQNKTNGGVYHKVTCAGFPDFVMANEETDELIVTPITATATGDFAAVMAMGYETFKDTDKELADKCLAAAEKAYVYLEAAPSVPVVNPDGIVTGEYGDKSDRDERYWATAELFKATGKSRYNEKMKQMVNQKIETGYDWATVGHYGNEAYLAANGADEGTKNKIKQEIVRQADNIVSASKNDGYGITLGDNFYWGCNMGILNDAVVLDVANTISPKQDYVDVAREQVNYVFGKNANAMSFVTGYGTDAPKHPHYRPSIVVGSAMPGMLIGGVNANLEDPTAKAYFKDTAPAKCYLDNDQCYSTNEVDIYWNSTLIHALAKTKMLGLNNIQEPDIPDPGQPEKPDPDEPNKPDPDEPNKPEPEKPSVDDKLDVKLTSTVSNEIRQVYTVKAKEDVDLSKVGFRYYFSKSDNKKMNVYCHNTGVYLKEAPWYMSVTGETTGEFGFDENGTYLEIRVNKSVMLKNDGSSMTIEAGFSNEDWSNMTNFKELGTKVVYYK